MSWQEGVAITVVPLGLGAGAFLVAQQLSFWIEFRSRLGKALLPLARRLAAKRMPPEEEAACREVERRELEGKSARGALRRIGSRFGCAR